MMAGKLLGDRIVFVLPAYLFIFGVWSAASSYDYISGKWQTVRSARRRGMGHLGLLVVPMAYMIAYIKAQTDADDAKEVSAAIIALLFALVEFFRTIVGLWQLHIFRHWTAEGVESMQSLGYAAKEKQEDVDSEDASGRDANAADGDAEASPKKGRRTIDRRTPLEIADSLTINDLIVDNRLSEGEINCIIQRRNSALHATWGQKLRSSWRWLSCVWYFPCLLVAICRSRKPLFTSPSSAIYLQPYNAEDIFMRWSCVLVAQVFPQWLVDMQKSGMSDMSPEDGSSRQLARFRRGLLCAAALHTQSSVPDRDQGGFSSYEPNQWRNYPKLCRGVFSLQEFLRVACESGSGLPFGVPHTKARAGGENSEYSYSKFKSKLYRIRDMFQVDDVEKLQGFETYHLEWLAVFLSVSHWSPRASSTEILNVEERRQSAAPFNSTKLALVNLRTQLGIPNSPAMSGLFLSNSLARFPLFGKNLQRSLWGNRNVLETSLHIDNILSLSAGDQFRFMEEMKTSTTERISKAFSGLGIPRIEDLYASRDSSSRGSDISQIVDDSSEANRPRVKNPGRERDRLLYQLVSDDPEIALFEQRSTFLGCSMERLRSALAEWVRNNPATTEHVWSPSLKDPESGQHGFFSFHGGNTFVRCLGRESWATRLGERHVQLRLLWELQNYFHGLIPPQGLSPKSFEAMILCLLSFPALSFSVVAEAGSSELTSKRSPDGVQIAIQPDKQESKIHMSIPFGPQPFGVEVHLELTPRRDVAITLSLEGEEKFLWQEWRDDFTTRLHDSNQWKIKNGLKSSPVVRTNGSISQKVVSATVTACGTGQEMNVWPGWLPHRPSMCLFELESEGYIVKERKEPLRLKFSQDWVTTQATGLVKSRSVPVPYREADGVDLEHASAVARRVISLLENEDKNVHDLSLNGARMIFDEIKQASTVSGEAEKEFRLKLSESVAVHHHSFDILEKVVLSWCKTENSLDVFTRAASMIESFCSLLGKPKGTFEPGAPGLHMNDDGTLLKVLSLVEKLASEGYVGHAMCKSFARVCTSFGNCDRLEIMKQASSLLLKKVVSAPHRVLENEFRALTRDLGSILGRVGCEDSPISLLLYSRYSETVGSSWYSNGVDALLGGKCPASPTLAAKFFAIGAFEDNDTKCLSALARICHHGLQNNPADHVRAKTFYIRAIEEGSDIRSMNNLGLLLQSGTSTVNADPARAVDLFKRAVDEGVDVRAMNNLALLLQGGGEGVDADPVGAFDLYTRAIEEGGHVPAMCNLAFLLETGAPGVNANPVRAVNLYMRAIDKEDDASSMYNLAFLLHRGAQGVASDHTRAVDLYTRVIDKAADARAMNNLAFLLHHGANGVAPNPLRAVDLYTRAIDKAADVKVMNNLASLLHHGAPGMDANPSRSVDLYSRAVDETGDATAMYSLAVLLHGGAQGVDADPARAVDLYSRVIDEAGDVRAMNNLALLLQHGAHGVVADPARAVDLYGRAIEQTGDAKVMINLALLLQQGADGVEADPARAVELYSRSIDEADDAAAMCNLALLLESGAQDVNADRARAVDLYRRAMSRVADVRVMFHLALLLQDGGHDFDADISQAIDLYAGIICNGAGEFQELAMMGLTIIIADVQTGNHTG